MPRSHCTLKETKDDPKGALATSALARYAPSSTLTLLIAGLEPDARLSLLFALLALRSSVPATSPFEKSCRLNAVGLQTLSFSIFFLALVLSSERKTVQFRPGLVVPVPPSSPSGLPVWPPPIWPRSEEVWNNPGPPLSHLTSYRLTSSRSSLLLSQFSFSSSVSPTLVCLSFPPHPRLVKQRLY